MASPEIPKVSLAKIDFSQNITIHDHSAGRKFGRRFQLSCDAGTTRKLKCKTILDKFEKVAAEATSVDQLKSALDFAEKLKTIEEASILAHPKRGKLYRFRTWWHRLGNEGSHLDRIKRIQQELSGKLHAKTQSEQILNLRKEAESKSAAIVDLKQQLQNLTSELKKLETVYEQLEKDIARKQAGVQGIKKLIENIEAQENSKIDLKLRLTQFDTKVSSYTTGTLFLFGDERAEKEALEAAINTPLDSAEKRLEAIANLNDDLMGIAELHQVNTDILQEASTQLTGLQENLSLQQAERDLKKFQIAEVKNKLLELDPDLDIELEAKAPENPLVNPHHEQPPAPTGSALNQVIDGTPLIIGHWDFKEMKAVQNIDATPVSNKHELWKAIHAENQFYQDNILPSMKLFASLLTSNEAKAKELVLKWSIELRSVAKAWSDSGSMDNWLLDSISFQGPSNLLHQINALNHNLQCVRELNIPVQTLLADFSALPLTEDLEFTLAMPKEQASALLKAFVADQKHTDLTPLFPENSPIRAWPESGQFFVAIAQIKAQEALESIETNPEFRHKKIAMLENVLAATPNAFVRYFMQAASKSSWAFQAALFGAKAFIPTPETKEDTLNFVLKNFTHSDEDKKTLNDALTFAKTDKRRDFEKKFGKLQMNMMEDVIDAVKEKNTSDNREIGKKGKEFNLQELIVKSFSIQNASTSYFQALLDYAKSIDNKDLSPKERKKLKEKVVESENQLAASQMIFFQSITGILAHNPNYTKVINTFDAAVLPNLCNNPPPDLTKEPFMPWFTQNVVKPFDTLTS